MFKKRHVASLIAGIMFTGSSWAGTAFISNDHVDRVREHSC